MKLSVSLQESILGQYFLFAAIVVIIVLFFIALCWLIWFYLLRLRRQEQYSLLRDEEELAHKTGSKSAQKQNEPRKYSSSSHTGNIPGTPFVNESKSEEKSSGLKKNSSSLHNEKNSDTRIVTESKSVEKPSGLKNNSTECYMNSIIQAVASSDKLIKQFNEIQLKYSYFQSLNNFVELLQNVNKSDNSDQHLCENTDLLVKLIRSVNWTKPFQQDTFELLSALINGIHQDLKSLNLENFEMPMKLKMVYQIKGMKIPNKLQYHIGLSLGLTGGYSTKPGVTIEYLIDQYFLPTIIDDDPNKTSKIFLYCDAPDVLLLHIQANKWDNEKGEMIKPEYYIKYDQEMMLNLNIVDELNKDEFEQIEVKYKIKAVVQHMGNIDGGHCVTYRNWNNQWFLVNDEQVESIEFNSDICPYIMIYEKC